MTRILVSAAVAAALMVAACSAGGGGAPMTPTSPPPSPAAPTGATPAAPLTAGGPAPALPHAQDGHYVGFSVPGFTPDFDKLVSFSLKARLMPNLVSFYVGMSAPFNPHPADQIAAMGALPLIQINPSHDSLAAIAHGSKDAWLRAYARGVRQFGQPIVLGFAHEFNQRVWPWSYKHVTPAVYIAAWRHIHRIFAQAGARNVIWVWTVNIFTPGTGPAQPYWPGNRYVDWVGLDGYFYNPTETFANRFSPTIAQVRTFTDRPILIAETGANHAAGRAGRIASLYQGMARTPGVLGFIWFDYHKLVGHDFVIDDDPAALAALRRGARTFR